jgi:hypothetical protein
LTFSDNIFFDSNFDFEAVAMATFCYQYEHVAIYKSFCDLMGKHPENVTSISDIPFLPISFFKTQRVLSDEMKASLVFESSTTTSATPSKHFVADETIYRKSFLTGFEQQFGDVSNYAVLGLLPSYLERQNSSLVFMVNDFISKSKYKESAFFMHDFENLREILDSLIAKKIHIILIGVTYALLDFAVFYNKPLTNVIVMETGGMKGRREELTKTEVHSRLKRDFKLEKIHAEYGMTELLSQAYSKGDGLFQTPAWMRILIRDSYAPNFYLEKNRTGGINVIDLANYFSCSFVETSDMGKLTGDGYFEVLGRMDTAEIRGCNLMYEG